MTGHESGNVIFYSLLATTHPSGQNKTKGETLVLFYLTMHSSQLYQWLCRQTEMALNTVVSDIVMFCSLLNWQMIHLMRQYNSIITFKHI